MFRGKKSLLSEPHFSAYHYLLHEAMLHIRMAGGKMSEQELFDLGDALHNVPSMILYAHWSDEEFRAYLDRYDAKWSDRDGGLCLNAILDQAIADARSQASLRQRLSWWHCKK